MDVKKEVSSNKYEKNQRPSSGLVRKNVQQRRNNFRVNPMAYNKI